VRFQESDFLREVEALVKLSHPCVLRVIGWLAPSQSSEAEIQTEIAQDGSLHRVLLNAGHGAVFPFWTQTRKAIIICGIAHVMWFVHSRNHIHCDLKPATILLNARGESLIIDFGMMESTKGNHLENDSGNAGQS
jgi:serine/threonine protein kinase